MKNIRSKFKKMKIRVKITLWYAGMTAGLLMVFLPILYKTISVSMLNSGKSKMESVMSHIILNMELESEDYEIPSNMAALITDKAGNIIYANKNVLWLNNFDFLTDGIREIDYKGDEYFLLDDVMDNIINNDENENIIKIRLVLFLEDMEEDFREILFVILAVMLVFFLFAVGGGFIIAKRALVPASRIAETVNEIRAKGDLSKRITGVESSDEIGGLAETFNKMLDSLEKSFVKEKRFVSDASHELRTPVSVIMAETESLIVEAENNETKKSLSVILTESRRMNKIISQLLMITRGIEGKYKLQFEDTRIDIVIGAVLEQLSEQAEQRSIELIQESQDEISAKADQSLITQMLLNLISNAIRYGINGGHVWVKAIKEKDKCLISIADDGIGIAQSDLPFVFDRFYRADTARDRIGSGLGLSIVNWIVDEHKGKIDVKSELGKGSIFLIWI